MLSARWGDRWRRIVGKPIEYDLSRYQEELKRIHEIGESFSAFSETALTNQACVLRDRARAGAPLNSLRSELFALVGACSKRAINLTPYDEQIIAGLTMSDGKVVEMQTGEGKTLASVAPVALHALTGAGAHVLTFNDYLAHRDAAWMGPIYRMLGLSVSHIDQRLSPDDRRRAYAADVTYVTAKEAGFDYLRDNLVLENDAPVHRAFHFALIDEADSILIDEATIPLVIATNVDKPSAAAETMVDLVRSLTLGQDFEVNKLRRSIALTDCGVTRLEAALGCNLYDGSNQALLADARNALHAEYLLSRDVDYVVRDARVVLVDDFTGRVDQRRQWPEGLQAAVEAKERVEIKSEGRILGSMTVQQFVTSYPRLCGMTATARAAADELLTSYGLRVVVIPTHVPCRRVEEPDVVFVKAASKRMSVVAEVKRARATGRPVLVGTASVRESEQLAAELASAGIKSRVLNAKNDAAEAEIVAKAGSVGAVTISTNMAGRGTDIRLGGPDQNQRDVVVGLGGLYVIGTNRHASQRVDLQLRGRCSRQGDPGTARFFVSLEDPLMEACDARRLMPPRLLASTTDEPIDDPMAARTVSRAQRMIEGGSMDIRRRLGRFSSHIERQRVVLHQTRRNIVEGRDTWALLPELFPKRWHQLVTQFGEADARRLEKRLTLLAIDRCWSDHLALANQIRDCIHVVGLVGKDPLAEFTRELAESFNEIGQLIEDDVAARFEALPLTGTRINWGHESLLGPQATWTYLVSDEPFGENALRGLVNQPALATVAAIFLSPLLMLWGLLLYRRRR
jgi:preprotein translocase subunit SecA